VFECGVEDVGYVIDGEYVWVGGVQLGVGDDFVVDFEFGCFGECGVGDDVDFYEYDVCFDGWIF